MQKGGWGGGGRGGLLVAELRVEGGVWYGGCVQRIEGIVKCQNFQRVITKKNYLIFFLNYTR